MTYDDAINWIESQLDLSGGKCALIVLLGYDYHPVIVPTAHLNTHTEIYADNLISVRSNSGKWIPFAKQDVNNR